MDRFVADQLLPFAALAAGQSRVRIPLETEHARTGMWLAQVFLGVRARLEGQLLIVPVAGGCDSRRPAGWALPRGVCRPWSAGRIGVTLKVWSALAVG